MNRLYKVLYIICFLLTLTSFILLMSINNIFHYSLLTIISFLTFLLALIFMVKNRNIKSSKMDVVFPIVFILFLILLAISGYIYNLNAMLEYIHFSYYYNLLLIPFIGLNVYTFLLFKKNK